MSNPVQAFVTTFAAGLGAAQSGNVTFSFAMTQGFEAWIETKITCPGTTSISAGAEVTYYRSLDGGISYETVGTVSTVFPKPTAASQVQKQDFQLLTGQYLVSVQVGGGCASTWTAQFGTAWIISAYA